MPSYEKDALMLAEFCAKCGGKCCRGHYIMLSKRECLRLSGYMEFPKARIDSPTGCAMEGIDALKNGKCPFLGTMGCVLSGISRPLVCRLFPITYTAERGKVSFYLSKKCPFYCDVGKLVLWTEQTKKEALDELSREWSGKEIRCFGSYLKKDGSELSEI